MISNYYKNYSYFQSLRDKDNIINAVELDNNFNNLVLYINNILNTLISSLSNTKGFGIYGSKNALLKNNVDKIDFYYLKKDDIEDDTIEFTNFKKYKSLSLIYTDKEENIHVLTPKKDKVLVFGNKIKFSKLTGLNFENNSITKDKIKKVSLNKKHLSDDIITRSNVKIKVLTKHIKDATLTNNLFKDGCFTKRKIDDKLLSKRKPFKELEYNDNNFDSKYILDNSLNLIELFSKLKYFKINNIPNNSVILKDKFKLSYFDDSIIPSNIKEKTVDLHGLVNKTKVKITKDKLSKNILHLLKL